MTAYSPATSEMVVDARKQKFFDAYANWNPEVDDGSELQRMEHEAGITAADWKAYHAAKFEIEF
jgi:hypothetical protein